MVRRMRKMTVVGPAIAGAIVWALYYCFMDWHVHIDRDNVMEPKIEASFE